MILPLTLTELRTMQNKEVNITAVIPFPWDEIGDIENLNDTASELITGSSCALEDISYKLVGVNIDTQEVLLEVCGSVENWLKDKDEQV